MRRSPRSLSIRTGSWDSPSHADGSNQTVACPEGTTVSANGLINVGSAPLSLEQEENSNKSWKFVSKVTKELVARFRHPSCPVLETPT
jgi:hypothetical protein